MHAESDPEKVVTFLTAALAQRNPCIAARLRERRGVARLRVLTMTVAALLAAPALGQGARTALGVFESWGAFRDAKTARCYAIATPETSAGRSEVRGYASVGFWPKSRVRQQLYVRLTRPRAANAELRLTLGSRRFVLTGNGVHGWAQDARMDAAIVAAMRGGTSMVAESRDATGRRIADRYALRGAATAIDAAALGCAGMR